MKYSYEWLVKYYKPGDKLYLFGLFILHDHNGWHLAYRVLLQDSLVVHTAQVLAAMLLKVLSYIQSVSNTNLVGCPGWSGLVG